MISGHANMRCACRANARSFQLENVIETAECPCSGQEEPFRMRS